MESIGNRLRRLRVETGETQELAASHFGISGQAFSSYERGDREPPIEKLIELSRYYHVTVDYLIGNSFERDASDVEVIKPEEQSESFDFLYDGILDKREIDCFWYAVRAWGKAIHRWNSRMLSIRTIPQSSLSGSLEFMALCAAVIGKIVSIAEHNSDYNVTDIVSNIKIIGRFLSCVAKDELLYNLLEQQLIEHLPDTDDLNSAWKTVETIAHNW